ncbi:MAG: alpha/beta hydrolase [Thermoguttaceae bacterium]
MKRACTWTIGLAVTLAWANLAAAQDVKVVRDVAYVEGGHERNRLDLYLPLKAERPMPLVVWIHGGGWQGGSKEGCPAVPLTGKGFAVASINYRLSQHAVFPAQIEDCKAAIRWLRANAKKYGLAADRIGVWGGSAGGHLVALLGVTGGVKELEGRGGNPDQSSRVQAVVDWYGPTDFVHWDPNFNKAVNPMIAQLLGGPAAENEAKARRASPSTYVGKDAAPILIIHGDKDNIVPLGQSEQFAEALKKAGVEAQLQIIKGSGHGGPAFASPENYKIIEEFLAKHLKAHD